MGVNEENPNFLIRKGQFKLIFYQEVLSDPLFGVNFSPDSRFAIYYWGTGRIQILDIESRKIIRELTYGSAPHSVAMTPDSKILVCGGYGWTVDVWELTSGELLNRIFCDGEIRGVVITPDGGTLVCLTDGTGDKRWKGIEIWDLISSKCIKKIPMEPDNLIFTVKPDGRSIIFVENKQDIHILDFETETKNYMSTDHEGNITSISITNDGKYLATGSEDGSVKVWYLEPWQLFRTFEYESGVNYTVFSHKKPYLTSLCIGNIIKGSDYAENHTFLSESLPKPHINNEIGYDVLKDLTQEELIQILEHPIEQDRGGWIPAPDGHFCVWIPNGQNSVTGTQLWEFIGYQNTINAMKRFLIGQEVETLMGERNLVEQPKNESLKFNLNLYIKLINFEQKLRKIVQIKLGKGWEKRIKHDLSTIYDDWYARRKKESEWGIEPEENIINYADLGDYLQIISQYSRVFFNSTEQMEEVKVRLKEWYNYGRNPVMHGRTVDELKFYTTQTAIDYLLAWMQKICPEIEAQDLQESIQNQNTALPQILSEAKQSFELENLSKILETTHNIIDFSDKFQNICRDQLLSSQNLDDEILQNINQKYTELISPAYFTNTSAEFEKLFEFLLAAHPIFREDQMFEFSAQFKNNFKDYLLENGNSREVLALLNNLLLIGVTYVRSIFDDAEIDNFLDRLTATQKRGLIADFEQREPDFIYRHSSILQGDQGSDDFLENLVKDYNERPIENVRIAEILTKNTLLVEIIGVQGTPYERGYFYFRIVFPKLYPVEHINVQCITIIFHPNIGRVKQNGMIGIVHHDKFNNPYYTPEKEITNASDDLLETLHILKTMIAMEPPGYSDHACNPFFRRNPEDRREILAIEYTKEYAYPNNYLEGKHLLRNHRESKTRRKKL